MRFKIPVAEPDIGDEERSLVLEALESGWVSGRGHFVRLFEREFAGWVGAKYGVAVNSGTSALHLALVALGVGSGDEVIVPDLTFAATVNAVLYTGARPVIVDVNPEYWCIDPDEVKRAVTPRTKAVIVVHLYGHPCDMDAILEVAGEYGLYVIEDAAEAHGAEYKGRRVGSFGDVGCFSFYANKIITTGEGGMCVTNDYELAERIRLLREHAMVHGEYWHEVVGYSYCMSNLQAALGLAQLRRANEFVCRKREIARVYAEELDGLDGVTLHPEMPWAKCVYWLYSILIDEEKVGIRRDELIARLGRVGIECRKLFYPLHTMPPYKGFNVRTCDAAVSLSERGVSLPSSVKLSDEDIRFISNEIKRTLCRR